MTRHAMRGGAPALAIALVYGVAATGLFGLGSPAEAAITATGDVTVGATDGEVPGPFRVGNTAYGTLGIQAGTPLLVSSGNAIVGETSSGIGLIQMTGLGSNLTTSGAGDVIIGNEGTGNITVAQLARLVAADDVFLAQMANSSGDLLVDGFGTTADVNDSLVVAVAGNAIMQVTNGGRVDTKDSILGQSIGGEGSVTVSGNASTLAQTGFIAIGDAGSGALRVITQGTVLSSNALIGNAATGTGLAEVSGVGSTWKISGFMNLGVSGLATLRVLDGGQASMTGALRLALMGGSEAHAVVSGVNALLTVGTTMTVGEFGFATLDVRNGARLNAGNTIIADNSAARGDVIVDGLGSTWKINGTLDVSDPGEAQLAITGGGLVTATGVVRIAAAGRLLMATGRLEAGSTGLTNNGLVQGTGRITGAVINTSTGKIRLSPGNSMILANTLTNSGLVDLDAGELETLGAVTNNSDIDARNTTLRTGGTGLDNNSGAQLSITEGSVDVFGAVDNNVGAQIVVGGGATAVFHDTLVNNGQFFVFPDAEVLALENLMFSPTSSLSLQLGEVEQTAAAATIESAGQAALAGSLAVTLAPGFAPEAGDAFQIITAAAGRTGTFATTMLPALNGGLAWDVDYAATSLTLSVVPGLTADFDGDGDVDAMDLGKWKMGVGKATGAVKTDGDADGDGDSDGADFLAWQRQLGAGPAAGAAATVPEPAAWGLAGIGLAAFRACHAPARRKRRNA